MRQINKGVQTRSLHVKIALDNYEKLKQLAKKQNRSMGSLLDRVLRTFFKGKTGG